MRGSRLLLVLAASLGALPTACTRTCGDGEVPTREVTVEPSDASVDGGPTLIPGQRIDPASCRSVCGPNASDCTWNSRHEPWEVQCFEIVPEVCDG